MWNRNDEETETSGVAGFLLGAVTGAIVGAGVALLFAPKTGKKMRQDLVRQYARGKSRLSDLASDAMDRVSSIASDAQERADEVIDRGRREVNRAATAVQAATRS